MVGAALAAGCSSSSVVTGVDTSSSQLISDAPNIALNGVDAGGVQVRLTGDGGRQWAGLPVSLAAPGCAVAPAQAISDAAGTAHFTVTCAQPRLLDVVAALRLGGVKTPLARVASLNFYPPSDARQALAPGTAINLQLMATGADGALDPSYRGRVQFSSSDPAASLPGDLDMTADMNGVAQLVAAVTLRSLGKQTVTASDANTQRLLAREAFLVSRGVGQATCEAPPTRAVAGEAFSLTLVGLHDDGSPDPAYSHQVWVTSSDPAAALPPPYTFTVAAHGRFEMTPAVTLFTAGAQKISITDQQTGVIRHLPIEVVAARAQRIEMACAEQLVAGESCPLSVTARDAFNNLAQGYVGEILLSTSDLQAGLAGSVALTSASGARAAAGSLTSHTSGLLQVAAIDSQDGSLTGSLSLVVAPAATAALRLTLPTAVVAGQPFSASLGCADGLGNITPAYRGSLQLTASHGRTVLPGGLSLAAADAGQRQLVKALVAYDAGEERLQVVDTAQPGLTAQATVAVLPATASTVVFQMPALQNAGVAADVNVLVADVYGNVVPSFTGTVSIASSDPAATLPGGGSLAFLAADAGQRNMPAGLIFRTAGDQKLIGQTSASGGITGLGASLVGPGVLAQIIVENIPAVSVVTQALSPRLRLADAFGNSLTSFVGSLNLSATPPGATVSATANLTLAEAGSITLPDGLVPQATGTLTLTATEPSSGLSGSATSSIGHGCWSYGGILPLPTPAQEFRLSLAMDANFRPAIAYDVGVPYAGGTANIMAQGWDGNSWHRFGASPIVPFADTQLVAQRLAIDRQGVATVAASGVGFLSVMTYSGGSWGSLAGGTQMAPLSARNFVLRRQYDIGVDAANAPWLVGEVDHGGGAIDLGVFIFTAGAWTSPPAGSAMGLSGANTWPSLAIDASGVPTLAWASTSFGNNEIFVARGPGVASGGSWSGPAGGTGYDNVSNNSSTSTAPVVALDAAGRPTVAWQDDLSGVRQIFVRRFNGVSWEALGASASGAGISQSSGPVGMPELAIDGQGYPVVTWTNPEVRMRRWNGSAWVEEYGSATGAGIAPTSSLNVPVAVDAQNRAVMFFDSFGGRVCSWR